MSDEVTPLDAAVNEVAETFQEVELLGKKYRLTKDLTLAATYGIDKAQRDESLSELVDAFGKVVHKDDRKAFLESVLSEDGEEISTEVFFEIFADALQKVTGRPLEQ